MSRLIDGEQISQAGTTIFDAIKNTPDSKLIKLIKVFVPDALVDGVVNAIALSLALQVDAVVLGIINDQIQKAGVNGLVFSSLNKEVMAADIDRFAAGYINAKLGTTLTGIRGLTKDELLENLGGVMADRINQEAGTSITNIFPVRRFREEISSGVIDQFDQITTGSGAVLTLHGKEFLQKKILSTMAGYAPPPVASTYSEAALAKNRLKQKKYRLTHKAIYVNTAKLAALTAAQGVTVVQLRNNIGLGD